MGELWLAYETSWQRSKNSCITAPECLGWGWLPLLALPAAKAKCPQQTLNLAIPDLLSESIYWQDHRHHLLSHNCLRPSLRPSRHYHTYENVQYACVKLPFLPFAKLQLLCQSSFKHRNPAVYNISG